MRATSSARSPGGGAKQRLDVGLGKPAQADPPHRGMTAEVGQEGRQRAGQVRGHVPAADHQQDRAGGGPHDVREHRERSRRGPVDVLDHDERARLCGVLEVVADGAEQPHLLARPDSRRRRAPPCRSGRAARGRCARARRRLVPSRRPAATGSSPRRSSEIASTNGPYGGRGLSTTGAVEHRRAGGRDRRCASSAIRRLLPIPASPVTRHRRRMAVRDGVPRRLERRELVLAPDERTGTRRQRQRPRERRAFGRRRCDSRRGRGGPPPTRRPRGSRRRGRASPPMAPCADRCAAARGAARRRQARPHGPRQGRGGASSERACSSESGSSATSRRVYSTAAARITALLGVDRQRSTISARRRSCSSRASYTHSWSSSGSSSPAAPIARRLLQASVRGRGDEIADVDADVGPEPDVVTRTEQVAGRVRARARHAGPQRSAQAAPRALVHDVGPQAGGDATAWLHPGMQRKPRQQTRRSGPAGPPRLSRPR